MKAALCIPTAALAAISFAWAQQAPPAAALKPGKDIVAMVNGEPITRAQLADELIDTYGAAHLQTMLDRKLVEQSCKKSNVIVADAEIESDINATCKQLRIEKKDLAGVLRKQGMTYGQYLRDRVWPKLGMVKLVREKVKVTDEDLKMGFEATYGAKVEVRMLATQEMRKSQDLWEKLAATPKGEARLKLFEDLAKEHSIDTSRSYGGKVSPINKHSSNPDLEKTMFAMKEGDLSTIMQVGEGNVFFLCVKHIAPQAGVTLDSEINPKTHETVRKALYDGIYTKKLQWEADAFFAEARKKSKVENFLTGDFDPEVLRVSDPPK